MNSWENVLGKFSRHFNFFSYVEEEGFYNPGNTRALPIIIF